MFATDAILAAAVALWAGVVNFITPTFTIKPAKPAVASRAPTSSIHFTKLSMPSGGGSMDISGHAYHCRFLGFEQPQGFTVDLVLRAD